MRKRLCTITFSILILLLCNSCARPFSTAETDFHFTDQQDQPDIENILAMDGRDNSLDKYSFFDNHLFEYYGFDGADRAITEVSTGINSFSSLKKIVYKEDPMKSYDILSTYSEGKEIKKTLPIDEQIWGIGSTSNGNGFISLGKNYRLISDSNTDSEGSEYEVSFFIEEYDSNLIVKKHIDLDFLVSKNNIIPERIAMDIHGNIHILYTYEENHSTYFVATDTGDPLWAEELPSSVYPVNLIQAPDGDILLLTRERVNGKVSTDYKFKHSFFKYSPESNRLTEYDSYEATFSEFDDYVTILNDKEYLIANKYGVYVRGRDNKQEKQLYSWINHGISVSNVISATSDEAGRIYITYSNADGENYIALKQTEEEIPIKTIQFAVNEYNAEMYSYAVAEFNRHNPSCIIELKSDYNDTALRTQLIAGDGPVLIDTAMVGFANNAELWEPLGNILDKMDILSEINEEALSLGYIDGTLYGIPIDYSIVTLITAKEADNWDYASFIDTIKSDAKIESIVMMPGEEAAFIIIEWLFYHSTYDNFFLSADKKNFDTDRFTSVIDLIERYTPEKESFSPDELINGSILCDPINIKSYEGIAAYNMAYDNKLNYIGFPTETGSSNYITTRDIIAVRSGASKDEKEVAFAFLNTLLSYRIQNNLSHNPLFAFSIRKDVQNERLEHLDLEENGHLVNGYGFIQSDAPIDKAAVKECYDELILNTIPLNYSEDRMLDIICEEMRSYYDEGVPKAEMIKRIKNRVNVLLKEHE